MLFSTDDSRFSFLRRALLLGAVVVCLAAAAAPVGAADRPVSFVNEIVPVLTKAGCNAGVCHAKAGNGQNGFQLSLLGFEPLEDFEHLVKEGRGRRLFSAAPDRSLLLLKASGQVPHGGGVRLDASSESYALLREWIRQGAPFDKQDGGEACVVRGSTGSWLDQASRRTATQDAGPLFGWQCSGRHRAGAV